MSNLSIKDWAPEDQPREKLLRLGAHRLSDSELLAILLINGTKRHSALDVARSLLQSVGNDLQQLAALNTQEMLKKDVAGFGRAKAIMLAAALELGRRRSAPPLPRHQLARSRDVVDYLRKQLQYRQTEVFVVLFLNASNKVIQVEYISEGGYTGTVADPRVILKKALLHNATALILCHNHPSGNAKPSQADQQFTRNIRQAAALLDIHVNDHIIVTDEAYYSFADEGIL